MANEITEEFSQTIADAIVCAERRAAGVQFPAFLVTKR